MLDDCLIEMNSSDAAEPVLFLAMFIQPMSISTGLIGLVGTFRPRELGFSLHPASWGHGFAQEAVIAFCQWFRAHFPHQQLFAKIDIENSASRKVCQRCGFILATDEEIALDSRLQLDHTRQTWLYRP